MIKLEYYIQYSLISFKERFKYVMKLLKSMRTESRCFSTYKNVRFTATYGLVTRFNIN